MSFNCDVTCHFPIAMRFEDNSNPNEKWQIFKDELLSRDVYLRDLYLHTPSGCTKRHLHHVADLSTLNFIFAREDYHAPKSCEVVMDVDEVRILNAIDDSMWEKIRCINVDAVFECPEVKDIVPKSYRRTQRGTALRFVQRS